MVRRMVAVALWAFVLAGCGRTNQPTDREGFSPPSDNASAPPVPYDPIHGPLRVAPPKSADHPQAEPPLAAAASGKPNAAKAPTATSKKTTDADDRKVVLGEMQMTAPESWTRKQSQIPLIAAAFVLPRAEGDSWDAQLTITAAGNFDPRIVERLREQSKKKPESASVQELEICGIAVTVSDSSGTNESPTRLPGAAPGPYRTLMAFLPIGGKLYVVSCSGPAKTMERNADDFHAFLQSMQSPEPS